MNLRKVLAVVGMASLLFVAACGGDDEETVAPKCGDNHIDAGEVCDGTATITETCVSEGFAIGDISCSATCTLDTSACQITGDSCSDAGALAAAGASGDTTNAADDYTPECGDAGAPDMVYEITLTEAAGVTVSVSGYDTVLELRSVSCDGNDMEVIDCNDDGGPAADDFGSEIYVEYLEAGTYYLIVDGYVGDVAEAGPFTLTVDITAGGYPRCGDNILQADLGELCDGTAAITAESCTGLGYDLGGDIACNDTCDEYDISDCSYDGSCGDGTINGPEVCDGSEIGTATCNSIGFETGTPSCADDCFNFAAGTCEGFSSDLCGDGFLDLYEGCDDTLFHGEYGPTTAYECAEDDVTLMSCDSTCGLSRASCTEKDLCEAWGWYGDDYCDACQLLGGNADPDCTTLCAADDVCANYFDTGRHVWTCTEAGLTDPDCGTCGDDTLDSEEWCEGDDLGGMTCENLGYTGGTLTCRPDCLPNTSGCFNEAE